MACGVPVISSNLSSLPEVIGRAGILVDPQDEIAIAQAIKRLILHPKLAKKIAKQAQIRSKKFSWSLAAHKTLKVFESI
jgi:glycosyltransferase involved in cell wall biosynthesis